MDKNTSVCPCIRTDGCTYTIFHREYGILPYIIAYKFRGIHRIFTGLRARADRQTEVRLLLENVEKKIYYSLSATPYCLN